MKYLGSVTDNKDLVTKKYVDNAVAGGGGLTRNSRFYLSRWFIVYINNINQTIGISWWYVGTLGTRTCAYKCK